MDPEWTPNRLQMDPERTPNGHKMDPEWNQGPSEKSKAVHLVTGTRYQFAAYSNDHDEEIADNGLPCSRGASFLCIRSLASPSAFFFHTLSIFRSRVACSGWSSLLPSSPTSCAMFCGMMTASQTLSSTVSRSTFLSTRISTEGALSEEKHALPETSKNIENAFQLARSVTPDICTSPIPLLFVAALM